MWNTSSGFCFVTFTEHIAGITGVTFNQNGQVVLSASLDGTVRAFDLNRWVTIFVCATPTNSSLDQLFGASFLVMITICSRASYSGSMTLSGNV